MLTLGCSKNCNKPRLEAGKRSGSTRRDIGRPWRSGGAVYGDRDILPRDIITQKLIWPNAERIFFIRHALRAGFGTEEIFQLTKIDRWFLAQIKEIVDFEEQLAASREKQ